MKNVNVAIHILGLWPEFFGCGLALLLCYSAGFCLLRKLRVGVTALEERVYGVVLGAPVISLIVFAMGVGHLLYPVLFLGLGVIASAVLFLRRRSPLATVPNQLNVRAWQWAAFLAVYIFFGLHYLWVAAAPEVSFDGSTYHTGLIARYLRDHAFVPIYTNFYAGMPQGAESIYLIAFAFGRNSAAALVQMAWWLLLPWVTICVCARLGKPAVGMIAGLLLFTSPVVAMVGTQAYVDVFLMTTLLAMFGFAELWIRERRPELALLAAALAGYCVAIKYTAFPAPLYLVGVLLWYGRSALKANARMIAASVFCAAAMFTPWMVRSWVFYRDPLFPLGSALFATPYMHPYGEAQYRAAMQSYAGIHSWTQIPLELTVHGSLLQGFLGPVFLLLPFGLLALRWPVGRRLLIAGLLFLSAYTQNIGTRFFLPCAAFWALALCLALWQWPVVALAAGLVGIVTSWPTVFERYCHPWSPRVLALPKKVIVGKEDPEAFKRRVLGKLYDGAALTNAYVPADARVLSLRNVSDGYTHAEVVVSYQGALNERLYQELYGPSDGTMGPWRQTHFRIPPGTYRRFRLLQTSSNPQFADVAELRPTLNGSLLPISSNTVKSRLNPFQAKFASDGNDATRWTTAEPARPGMLLEFGVAGQPDELTAVTSLTEPDAHWCLQGMTEAGAWITLDNHPVLAGAEPAADLRAAVARDLMQNGVYYILLEQGDSLLRDFEDHQQQWHAHHVASRGAYSLFLLQ